MDDFEPSEEEIRIFERRLGTFKERISYFFILWKIFLNLMSGLD